MSSYEQPEQSETFPIEALTFLKAAWKVSAIFGLVGIALAICYLRFAPKQYEATSKITMAQLGVANNILNPLGVNIEDPSLLIARLSSPTSFPSRVTEACGLKDQENFALLLAKSIKLEIPRGVANVVELKTYGSSPQVAELCNESVFELIKVSQEKIVAPYIQEAKIKLVDDEVRLAKAKEFVAKADKSAQAMSATYLATRDEIRFLLDEIAALKNVVNTNQNRATRLVAPIYTNNLPISPKNLVVLFTGLFFGFSLGLLIMLGKKWYLEASL